MVILEGNCSIACAPERVFNTAKDVLGTKRLSLKPAYFESLLFLKYNLRALNNERRAPPQDSSPPNRSLLPPPIIDSSPDSDTDESSDVEIISDSE